MKYLKPRSLGLLIVTMGLLTLVPLSTSAAALATISGDPAAASAQQTARLQRIIKRGTAETSRRLTTLGKLGSKIKSTTKLTTADQTTLSTEVNTELIGLQSLTTRLNGDTTLAAAQTDAQSIFSEYRVYALIVPKVYLVKTADDQQLVEAKLGTLGGKMQTAINSDQTAGKNVSGAQAKLSDFTTQLQAAQTISSHIESAVVALQPSDYNADHTLLSGDRDQLKTAQADLATAFADARTVISDLKSL